VGAAALTLFATAAWPDDANSYLQSAHQLEKAHDLHGAEIQLRNAIQAAPDNGAIRLELAQLYLKMHNPNGAEAELFAAHMHGTKEELTAPLMAQAMLAMGEYGDLIKNVPAGNRPPKIESAVRSHRGTAELGLGDLDRARQMFADAERLDPKSVLPFIGEARLLVEEHQYDAAVQKTDQALKLDPKNADVHDAKGMILSAQGKPDAAMQEFAAALAVDPGDLRARLDRANLEAGRNNLNAAEKDLAAVDKIAPGSVVGAYLEATIDSVRGKYKESDALLTRLRGMMGALPAAYILAAQVKIHLNEYDQAENFLIKAAAQPGNQSKAYELLGALALKRGRLEDGIAAFEKAVQLGSTDAAVFAALGQAYVAHGDLDKAKTVFAQAAAKAPGNAAVATDRALADFLTGDREQSVIALGEVFKGGKGSLVAGPPLVIEALQIGQLDIAEAAARQLLQRDPANTTDQELLAAVRMAQHDYAGAESLLRELVAKQPNLASARRDLANVYFSTNRLADARKLYQDRLNANPKDVESLEALAQIAFRMHDDKGAVALLTRAQNAAPADPRPSLLILAMLQTRSNWPEAIGRARALQAKFGKDAGVADTLAELYFKSGNHPAAVAAYKAAIAKFPTYAPIFVHYAGVLAADKNYAGAAQLAQRSVQLDSHSPDLKRAYVTLTYLAHGTDAAFTASQEVTADKTGLAATLLTAAVLNANNNRAGAIALLEKRQAQSPSGSVAVRLAVLYQLDKRAEQGRALLDGWARAHPNDIDVRFMLAQFDSAAGQLDKARVQYEWLATQRPDNPLILNNLAYIYDSKHDPRARVMAEKAMKLAPASGSVADTLGWIMAEQGDTAGAAKYLGQASASRPTDSAIQYHYAVVLSKTGKADQARDVLQKMMKLNMPPDTKNQAQLLLAKLGGTH
jgi:putative PEP-CTERM system TPR-repeat lipoprotein